MGREGRVTHLLTVRSYRGEDDYWRIRAFLREVHLLNDRRERSWHVARLDYWRWHGIENCQCCPPLEEVIVLWETSGGRIAAVLNPEEIGSAFLQVHPDHRTVDVEEEMIGRAEERLAVVAENGRRRLTVWATAGDELRLGILRRRGYAPAGWSERQHYRLLSAPLADAPVPSGYSVRSLGYEAELPARSWASWRGFHPDEPDDRYGGWQWYPNIQRQPLYRRDLDIVAVAPDGTIAAFCTLWFDDVTRSGYFEPVATVPEQQRKGLARAVMTEAMRRIQSLGATQVSVSGSSPRAKALYDQVVGPAQEELVPWVREW
jgi:mycothiol synthase